MSKHSDEILISGTVEGQIWEGQDCWKDLSFSFVYRPGRTHTLQGALHTALLQEQSGDFASVSRLTNLYLTVVRRKSSGTTLSRSRYIADYRQEYAYN